MAANQEKASTTESSPRVITIDPTAPAGSENALGAESVRDGRPATRDEVVEAMDEEGLGITIPLAVEKASGNDGMNGPG
jgi:hypothetical protein